MAFTPLAALERQKRLGIVFRTVRLYRRLRITEVACALGVCRRTYENIEAGRGPGEIEHLYKFATVTRSDVYSLLAAIEMASPEWAVRSIETKTMMVAVCSLAGLDATLGESVSLLEQGVLIYEMNGVCERLVQSIRQGLHADHGMAQKLDDLGRKLQQLEARQTQAVSDDD